MEIFEKTRLKIGRKLISRKLARTSRKVSFSNINNVKNIGIVWDASNPDDFVHLTKFYQQMQERSIEVKILGYYPGKELPDKYTAIRYLTCLRRKEINFFYHPNLEETKSFINKNFEILIDINFNKLLPLEYVSTLSNASLKVGLFESENRNTQFDMMMEISRPVKIDDYFNNVIHYLEMINSNQKP